MPRVYKMSWDCWQFRWVKMYKGKRYAVSCSTLDAPPTKEESYQAANVWWTVKKAELDGIRAAEARKRLAMEDIAAADLGADPDIFADVRTLLLDKLAKENDARIGDTRTAGGDVVDIPIADPLPADAEAAASEIIQDRVMGVIRHLLFGAGAMPPDVAERLPPARVSQIADGVKAIRGESAAAPDRTVKAQLEKWFATQERLVGVGEMTPARYAVLQTQMNHFRDFLGADADVKIIDTGRLDDYAAFVQDKVANQRNGERGWSSAFARDLFATTRRFVRWLWESGLIELPKSINKKVKFGSAIQAISTWSIEEVRTVTGAASERTQLYLLLMLNCGFTQRDVADLLDSEVDWKAGTITRKRSKTKKEKNAPVVCYKLWPITLRLLRQFRSGKKHVLLSERGRQLVRDEMKNGKCVACDLIAANFLQLQKKLGFRKPMKQLRKTGSSMLETHETYGRFATLYLGHAPATMKDRHYAAPPQNLFDQAVLWLGQQFGFVD